MTNQSNKQPKIMVRDKVDITSPVKLVFGGFVRFANRFAFTTALIFMAFFMHGYFVHMVFSPYLLAGAIIMSIIWILCASTENSWFDAKKGTAFERITRLERAMGV